jgi:serine protease Do
MTKTITTVLACFLMAGAPFVTSASAQGQPQAPTQILPNFADLVEKYGPAVVSVSTQARQNARAMGGLSEDDPWYELFRRFMPPQDPRQPRGNQPQQPRGNDPQQRGPLMPFGAGSGFFISSDGYLLTNAHVVDKADEVTVTLTDRREFTAKVIGADKRTDIAVLKIEAANLPKVTFGDSNKLRVGEWVLAIGSPFRLSNTATAGIVSAKGRDGVDSGGVAFIQTDVAVNPGNSGGPLFNLKGEVVGINSQILSRTGGYQGISFAIPIEDAIRVSDQIIKTGKVSRGRLGVLIGAVVKDHAEALGLPRAAGAIVSNVEKDSPAEKAGLLAGDVIMKIEGRAVETHSEVTRIIGNTRPGTKLTLSVWRNGAARDIAVTVGEFKDEEPRATKSGGSKDKPAAKPGKLGVAVTDLTAEQKKELKVTGGVVVEAVQGNAASVVQQGDVILRVNNTDIANVKQFNEVVAKLDLKKAVALLVRSDETSRVVTFRPDGD